MEDNTHNQNQEKTDNKQQKPAAPKPPLLKIDPTQTIPYFIEGAERKN